MNPTPQARCARLRAWHCYGIVMEPPQARGFHVPAQGATDALDTVGHDGPAMAGTAQYDTPFKFAARDGLRHRPDEPGIIHQFFRMRAKARDRWPRFCSRSLIFSLYRNPAWSEPMAIFTVVDG